MTIIQPGNKNIAWLNSILTGLIILSVLTAFWLVVFYTRLVNINHGIAETERAIQEMQTGNAELKDQVFALLDRTRLESLAAERNLVKEKSPKYLETGETPLALSR